MNTNILNKSFFLVLLLISACIFTGCQTKNEGCIRITVETSSQVSVKKSIEDTFGDLPMVYQEKLITEGWEIVYTGKEIEDIYDIKEPLLEDIMGVTDTKSRKIYIEEGSLDRVLHELVHACVYNTGTGSSFYIKYEGVENEMKESGLERYYTENYDEYIVENIARYLKDHACLNEYPITKKTAEEMLQDTLWLQQ